MQEAADTDEWGCWDDDPVCVEKIIVPVSKDFVGMLNSHEVDLVSCYKAIGPVYESSCKPLARSAAILKKRDHEVADALITSLHPDLLVAAKALFLPANSGDLFDMTEENNQLRHAFLNCFDSDRQTKKNYKTDLVYQSPYLMMGGRVLVDSPCVIDHLEYISHNHPKDLWEFFVQARSYHRTVEDTAALKDMLRLYRAGRRVSKSLNKFTKVSQLPCVDYDNPFFWFDLDGEGLEAGDIVLVGEMPQQVLSRYADSLYDPRCERTHVDKVVLANAVSGDESGTYSVDVHLLSKLYSKCVDCVIYCHTVPDEFKPPPLVLRKPRPHNLTAVIRLGESDRGTRTKARKAIRRANEARNGRYLNDVIQVNLLDQYRGVDYVLNRYKGCPVPVVREVKQKGRKTRQYEARDALLERYERDKGYRFSVQRTIHLPGKPGYGRLVVDIPHWGDADLIMGSLYKRAVDAGYKVAFEMGKWRVV